MRSSDLIYCFALLMCMAFDSLMKPSLFQSMSFLLCSRLSPPSHQGRVNKRLCGAKLQGTVKPEQSFVVPNIGLEGFEIMMDLIGMC